MTKGTIFQVKICTISKYSMCRVINTEHCKLNIKTTKICYKPVLFFLNFCWIFFLNSLKLSHKQQNWLQYTTLRYPIIKYEIWFFSIKNLWSQYYCSKTTKTAVQRLPRITFSAILSSWHLHITSTKTNPPTSMHTGALIHTVWIPTTA